MRRLPYEFENEWFILIPVLRIVYVLTTWIDGQIFGSDETQVSLPKRKKVIQPKSEKKGFGDA